MLWYVGWRTTLLEPLSSFHYRFPGLTWHCQASTAGVLLAVPSGQSRNLLKRSIYTPCQSSGRIPLTQNPFSTSSPPHFQQMVQTDNESQESGTHNLAYNHTPTNMRSLCFPRNPCFLGTHIYPSPDPDRQKAKCFLTPRFLCTLPHWTQIGKWIHVSCF